LGWSDAEVSGAIGTPRVCGGSVGCKGEGSWGAAEQMCEAEGARLCTQDEILADEVTMIQGKAATGGFSEVSLNNFILGCTAMTDAGWEFDSSVSMCRPDLKAYNARCAIPPVDSFWGYGDTISLTFTGSGAFVLDYGNAFPDAGFVTVTIAGQSFNAGPGELSKQAPFIFSDGDKLESQQAAQMVSSSSTPSTFTPQ